MKPAVEPCAMGFESDRAARDSNHYTIEMIRKAEDLHDLPEL